MPITAGHYTIGTADASYTTLAAFKADLGTMTGDITGTVITPLTITSNLYINGFSYAGHTLCIDNAAKRVSHLDNANQITFDATGGAFHGFIIRNDNAAATDATLVIRNQYFRRINSTYPTGGQTADILNQSNYNPIKLVIENNVFYSPFSSDGSSWYAFWNQSAKKCLTHFRYNHVNGYRIGMIMQNSGDNSAVVSNNSFYNQNGTHAASSTSPTKYYNNVALGWSVGTAVTDGTSNTSENTTANNFVGPNFASLSAATQMCSTDWSNARYMTPYPVSKMLHNGVISGIDSTVYFNGLPVIPNDITIGCNGAQTPPPPMVTT
jgi:hypothetical protein